MNIVEKAQLCREIYRVLKPGGRLVWSEVALGPVGPALFPLPWARIPGDSFLIPPQVLRQAFVKAGFRIFDFVDETERFVGLGPGPTGSPPALAQQVANQVVLGADFIERRQNLMRNMLEGRLVSILIAAEKL
jgi:arsenite methyltransferase